MAGSSLTFPREYNAAADLIGRNLQAGRGDKIAYYDAFGSVTYAELARRVDRAGDTLRALGLQMEQRVLLALVDTVDFVAVFLGAMKIGAVPVPVNTWLTPLEYEHMLRDSRARVLVVSDALLPRLRQGRDKSPWLKATIVARTPEGGPDDGHPRLCDLLAVASHRRLTRSPRRRAGRCSVTCR